MREFVVEFGPGDSNQLSKIAKARKCSKVDVVRHALNVYSFLEEKVRNGGDIYFTETANGEKSRLILNDQ